MPCESPSKLLAIEKPGNLQDSCMNSLRGEWEGKGYIEL